MSGPMGARLLQLSLVLLASVGAAACISERKFDREPERGELPVLSDLNNAPFAFVDADGEARGRDVEMMEAVADFLGFGLAWQRRPFEELLPHAMDGEPGVICATIGITAERARHVDFTQPYFLTELRVVVRSGAGEPDRLADLTDRTVAAGTGTTSQTAVERLLPTAIHLFENKSGNTSLQRLMQAEVDAIVMDGPAAQALVESSGAQLRLLGESLGGERYALVLPQGQDQLLAELNRALAHLEQSGFLAQLNQKFDLKSAAP